MVNLYAHQSEALKITEGLKNVAFYHDMGLGKTYTGSEALKRYGSRVNLIVCQKSKIADWLEHLVNNYPDYTVLNLTNKTSYSSFIQWLNASNKMIGVINYELAFRRPELLKLRDFTLMLDESSLIQNEKAKRSKFILKLKPSHVILLSGTPTGGKYEKLYSQLKLLGWNITKTTFYSEFIEYHFEDYGGVKVLTVDGYKNVERLKRKMREYGCHFLKTDEVLDLPEQIFTKVSVPASIEYKKFRRDKVVTVNDHVLTGDNALVQMMYERQLCGRYSAEKLTAFRDLLESTEDRVIVFYNFTDELFMLQQIAHECERRVSVVNGQYKSLSVYESDSNSVTLIQYQAGAMGLNLQLANKIIYFTPPLSSELYEQSKKRINRIGQSRTCYYYNLTVSGSIEERIYKTLAMRRDFTEALFKEVE